MIFKGIRTNINKKPYIFVIFQGGPDLQSPPLDLCKHPKFVLSYQNENPLSHDVASWSAITPCNKIDEPVNCCLQN